MRRKRPFPSNAALRRGLAAALALASAQCGSSRPEPDDGSPDDQEVEPDSSVEPPDDLELELGPRGLEVAPGHSRTITVQVTPPGEYVVTWAVVGNGNGAFLDRDRVETARDGTAAVELTVPFEAPAFAVRASTLGVNAELPVAIGPALATVVVEPTYVGLRAIGEWTVGVSSDPGPCPDQDKYDVDGVEFPVGEPIVLERVPAAKPVHVFARGEHYVFGCVADVSLRPGVSNVITLTLTNRPVRLDQLALPFTLSLDRSPEFEGALRALVALMVERFRVDLDSDADGLLAAMAELYTLRAPDFGKPRYDTVVAEFGWRAAVQEHLRRWDGSDDPLSAAVEATLIQSYEVLFETAGFAGGELEAAPAPESPSARLVLEHIGGLPPDRAGVATALDVVLTATSDDNVSVGFPFGLRPVRLLAELAQQRATSDGELLGVPGLLAQRLDCAALGQELAALSPQLSEPLPQCDGACIGQLCVDGLSRMWGTAAQAALAEQTVEVLALGPAELDTSARPTSFTGAWAGQTILLPDSGPIPIGGPFVAGGRP